MTKTEPRASHTPTTTAPRSAPTPAPRVGGGRHDDLRGRGYDEQAAALSPDAADAAGPAKAAPAGPQPGPHAVAAGDKGRWVVSVAGLDAAFNQQVTVHGAHVDEGNQVTADRSTKLHVDAPGPWSIAVTHQVPQAHASWAMAKGKEVGPWLPSTHRTAKTDPGLLIETEDFQDNDFNDLVLSVARDPAPPKAEDPAAPYLVSAETRVDGGVTTHDLILGADADGTLDVVLNSVCLTLDDVADLDLATLRTLATRLADFSGEVAAAEDLGDARVLLDARIGGWRAAITAALAQRTAGEPAGSAPNA